MHSVYLSQVINIPWHQLKFLDESHFDQRRLYQRRGWAASDRRIQGIRPKVVGGIKSCTITIMTSLDEAGGFVCSNPLIGGNTADHFVSFILDLIGNGYLVMGDYLILDNVGIHIKGAYILHDTLINYGINLRFLPKYSPELNPCELIFAQIKSYMRNNRRSVPIEEDLIAAIPHIHRDHVWNYYRHCIDSIYYA